MSRGTAADIQARQLISRYSQQERQQAELQTLRSAIVQERAVLRVANRSTGTHDLGRVLVDFLWEQQLMWCTRAVSAWSFNAQFGHKSNPPWLTKVVKASCVSILGCQMLPSGVLATLCTDGRAVAVSRWRIWTLRGELCQTVASLVM